MAQISKVLIEQIRVSAEQCYPNECCGLLLGKDRSVIEIRAVENVAEESRRSRYLISPLDLYNADNYVRGIGLEVIGVYHSHPDHPARPSTYDREHAVPHYLYLIVNVTNGRAGDIGGWTLGDWESPFVAEDLLVVDEQPGLHSV